MEQKIHNTFTRMEDEIEKFDKVFAQGGKFEQAVAQTGGDIAWFDDIREALDKLADALMEGHQAAMPNMDEDLDEGDSEVNESTLTEGVLDGDDDDGFMARSQLYFLARDAIQLHGIIDDRDDLEPWVQSKISQAAQGIDAVRRYSEYNALKQAMPQDDDQELMAQANKPLTPTDAEWSKILQIPSRDSFDKMIKSSANESMMQRWDAIKESVEDSLMDKVLAQIVKDVDAGDMTAIQELLDSVSERDLMAFLSEIEEAMKEYSSGAPASSIRPKARPTMTRSLRPKARPTKRIGGMPGGSTRGIDPKDNYSPEDLKRLLMQGVDEDYAKDYADVLATNNDIKINRYLATIPQDVAKKLTGNRAHFYKLSDIAGVEPKRTDAPYSHDTNPAYQATKAKRQKGIPMKDTIKRMHPELFDDENFDEGSYGKKKKKKYYEDVDTDAVRELVLYADNDGDLYQTSTAPVQKNLSRKWKKGVYDHDLAIKLWKYHADRAAKKYADEFGGPVMSPDVRRAAAKEFADSWKAELEAGNLHEEKESEGIKAMKKAGNAKADAEAKEKEKVDEGMEFDDKRDDDLQTVAKDLFAHAKAAAKKKAK